MLRLFTQKELKCTAAAKYISITMFQVLFSSTMAEFCNKLAVNLKIVWARIKNSSQKPRHSQSKGSVGRANQDIDKCKQHGSKTMNYLHGIQI